MAAILQLIFFDFIVLFQIWQKFVFMGPINNIPALVQIMAWHWTGHMPLSESMMALYTEVYIYVTLGEHNKGSFKIYHKFKRSYKILFHVLKPED